MPRNPQPEKTTEDVIQEGIQILREQQETNPTQKPNITTVQKQLEEKYHIRVPYYTLRNRFNGLHQTASSGHAGQQLLSPEQEAALVEWLELLSDAANPASKRTLRKMAQSLCGKKPGTTWVRAFLKRHPKIKLGKPSGLDPKRGKAFNKPVVGRYFNLLKELVEKHGITPDRMYNMDEKGCQRGGGRKAQRQKYFVPRNRRPKYKHRSDNLELVTIIECVCADGTAIDPGFVFSGAGYHPEWYEGQPNISIGLTENGWTSDTVCFKWFEKTFLPQVRAKHPDDKPILLIYDGHGSHETLELLRLAKANNIILLSLPPHTTHKLQPLDVGVFGPFSNAWTTRCDEIIELEGQEMRREDFVREYMEVRRISFKNTTIQAAWRRSGAYPINPGFFKDNDYAPSLATSYANAEVPPSFPLPDFYHDIETRDTPHSCEACHDDDNDSDDVIISGSPDTPLSAQPSPSCSHSTPGPSTASTSPLSASLSASSISTSDSAHSDDPPSPPPAAYKSRVPHATRTQFKTTEMYVLALEAELAAVRSESGTLGAHCILVYNHYTELKRKHNAKDERKQSKKRKLNVEARHLTSDEFMALMEKENSEREAEEKRKEQERLGKETVLNERQQQREKRLPSAPFSGSLKAKNKEDLKDVAYRLGLSLEGTNNDLVTRIESHFGVHPALREDPVFSGLFHSRRGNGSLPSSSTAANDSQPTPLTPGITFNTQPSQTMPPRLPPNAFQSSRPSLYFPNPTHYSADVPPFNGYRES